MRRSAGPSRRYCRVGAKKKNHDHSPPLTLCVYLPIMDTTTKTTIKIIIIIITQVEVPIHFILYILYYRLASTGVIALGEKYTSTRWQCVCFRNYLI